MPVAMVVVVVVVVQPTIGVAVGVAEEVQLMAVVGEVAVEV
jgi:hypothetical protein